MKGRKPIPQGLKPALILLDFYGMAEAMPFQNTAQTEFVNTLGTASEAAEKLAEEARTPEIGG